MTHPVGRGGLFVKVRLARRSLRGRRPRAHARPMLMSFFFLYFSCAKAVLLSNVAEFSQSLSTMSSACAPCAFMRAMSSWESACAR